MRATGGRSGRRVVTGCDARAERATAGLWEWVIRQCQSQTEMQLRKYILRPGNGMEGLQPSIPLPLESPLLCDHADTAREAGDAAAGEI